MVSLTGWPSCDLRDVVLAQPQIDVQRVAVDQAERGRRGAGRAARDDVDLRHDAGKRRFERRIVQSQFRLLDGRLGLADGGLRDLLVKRGGRRSELGDGGLRLVQVRLGRGKVLLGWG